jgi:hypothetical protein
MVTSGCSHSQRKLSFVPLTALFRTSTLGEGKRQSITRFEYYLVDNYDDNKIAEEQIDNFALGHVAPDTASYTDYHIIFYKSTKNTTVETIKDANNSIPPESLNDIIYDYWWHKGKFLVRNKFKNGKIIDPRNDIEVHESSKDSIPPK